MSLVVGKDLTRNNVSGSLGKNLQGGKRYAVPQEDNGFDGGG